jgi:hypothetical protein
VDGVMATKLVSRRMRILVAAALILAATATIAITVNRGSSEAAPLAATCTLTVPAKLYVEAPYHEFTATKSCTGATINDVSWKGRVGTGAVQHELWFLFENQTRGKYHDDQALTKWTWTGSVPPDPGVAAAPAIDVTFNSPTTDVRVKSTSYMNVSAPDSVTGKVTLESYAQRYAYSLDKFIPYAGAVGIVKYRENSTDTWKGLKNINSDSGGYYKYIYTPPAGSHRQYQVQFFDATYVWGNYGIVSQ